MFGDTLRLAWRMQVRDKYRLPAATVDRETSSVVALPSLLREPASAGTGVAQPATTEAF
jgi:hypothetical protein